MLALAAPALGMRLGLSDAGTDPASTTTRQAYDLLAKGFGPGFNGPLIVAAALPQSGDTAAATQLSQTLSRDSGGRLGRPAAGQPVGHHGGGVRLSDELTAERTDHGAGQPASRTGDPAV